jgi:phosphatidylglycerol:prolipoprotein diacylglycerol transferase
MDKVAFHIGSFPIHWYGVLVAAGFWLGLWSSTYRAAKAGISPERVWDAGLWLIVGTILGARILHVITYWDQDFAGKPISEIFMVQHGGLVFYGGLIGATLSGIIFLRVKRLPMWKFGDALAPGIPLGYAIGRMGCLMNGCCYGKPTSLPWAIHFPADHETHGIGVHPTQVYESLLSLALFGALTWFWPRRKFDGQVFAIYLMSYAVLRSVVEFFRGDYPVLHLGGWATQAHLISFGIFAAGLILYWQLSRPKFAEPARAMQ